MTSPRLSHRNVSDSKDSRRRNLVDSLDNLDRLDFGAGIDRFYCNFDIIKPGYVDAGYAVKLG